MASTSRNIHRLTDNKHGVYLCGKWLIVALIGRKTRTFMQTLISNKGCIDHKCLLRRAKNIKTYSNPRIIMPYFLNNALKQLLLAYLCFSSRKYKLWDLCFCFITLWRLNFTLLCIFCTHTCFFFICKFKLWEFLFFIMLWSLVYPTAL